MLLLLAPVWQQIFSAVPNWELKGAIEKKDKATFSLQSWWDASFQKQQEAYSKQSFGFYDYFVRAYNQIDYSIFNKINAKDVVEGKDGFLFEQGYIDSYFGLNFLGEESINEKVEQIKAIQTALASMNKQLLVLIAAGKGSFYPEYFPEQYDHITPSRTNYAHYIQQFDAKEVAYIDFNKWFLEMKDTTTYPLFPQTGIHWSSYSEYLVMDSLLRYLEDSLDADLTDLVCRGTNVSKQALHRDKDIEEGMNLLQDLDAFPLAYPQLEFIPKNKTRPKGLVVADSYYWGLYNAYFTHAVFEDGSFWFYNKQAYPSFCDENTDVDKLDFETEVLSNDLILLMANDSGLKSFSWSFIKKLYLILCDQNAWIEYQQEQKLVRVIKEIRADERWYAYIIKTAKEKNESIDTTLRNNAIYTLKERKLWD